MMVAASLAMLAFVTAYKDYGSQLARFGLLAFYTVVIAGVTVFMVSCNYHNIGLSISRATCSLLWSRRPTRRSIPRSYAF